MSLKSRLNHSLRTMVMKYNNYRFNHVCWLKSWLYNAMWFGLKQSFKMPILIFNDVEIMALGRIVISGPIERGMIHIGAWKSKAHNSTRIFNNSLIIFNGRTEIRGGVIIENDGTIEFKKDVRIGENCEIMCQDNIVFGDRVSIGFETQVMDTDFHFVLNMEKQKIRNCHKPTIINNGAWVSSNCKVMKGTVIPEGAIVAGNSLFNQDYSSLPQNTLFAGSPAKPIKEGFRRIQNMTSEKQIKEYFLSHPEAHEYLVTTDNIDDFCCGDLLFSVNV